MEWLNSIITTYQQKICKHDRQIWEQSYEADLFKKLNNIPRKAAKINTSLIDVDLFRGSAFSISKSQSGWLSIVTLAWLRLIFFPFYYKWWLHSTCCSVFGLLCILYIFQLSSLVVLYLDFHHLRSIEMLTVADFITPYIMMYVLTVVHCLITANYNFPVRHSSLSTNGKRSKTSFIHSFQGHISENLSKSDQTSGKKAKEDSQNLLNGKPKDTISTAVGNFCDFPTKLLETETEIIKSKESLVGSLPSVDSQASSSTLELSSSKSCQMSLSNVELFTPSVDLDRLPRNVSSTACVVGVDCRETESSKFSEESLDSDSPMIIAATVSLLTVVDSAFEEPTMMDASCEHSAADVQDSLTDEDHHQKSSKMHRHLLVGSVSKSQKEINGGVVESMFRTSDVYEEQCSDVVNIADSNTSMSDTCNSSFVSSADDDDDDNCAKERAEANARARNFSAALDKKFKKHDAESTTSVSFGVRQRRKPTHKQTQSPVKRSPLRTFENIHGARIENIDVCGRVEKRGRLVSEALDQEASSDEEINVKPGVKLRGSVLRTPIARKSCVSCHSRKSKSDDAEETSCVEPSLCLNGRDSSQVGIRNGLQDFSGCEKRSQSLPFVKNVSHPDCDTASYDRQSPFHRSSGQSSSEKSLHSSSNAAAGTTDPLPGGFVPSSILNCITSTTDKVSCMIWSAGGAVHKVDLTIFDIGWTIVRTVNAQQERCDYMMLGILLSFVITGMPSVYRIYQHPDRDGHSSNCTYANSTVANAPSYASFILGSDMSQSVVLVNGMIQRLCLSLLFFFLLSVAERTFKQKLLYAKYFCYLTSSRKAKKYDLPHFRLNKVRNIKTWLSLRSFLKKRGPQRSVESVVSSSFILAVILVSILCIELLQDYGHFLEHLGNWELVLWGMILGIYLLRFITLGTKINKKYRNLSVLITEQINLYLHMEQKPHKKASLMAANNVLKLAEGLVKELESPFKISGLSANPFLYNITKVVILSAFSAVLTELLGFKLKLYKIKIRS